MNSARLPLHKDSQYNPNFIWGEVPQDILDLFDRCETSHQARHWQEYIAEELRTLGYKVRLEVYVEYGVKKGRIDIVAYSKDGKRIAIELDYRTVKKKSILKVQEYKIGIVALRDPKVVRL